LQRLALQYVHDLPHAGQGAPPRGASPTPCLRDGNHRSVDHRGDTAGYHAGPLLAGNALELALTPPHDPLLVVILGPTASGKTALSLALAQRFHGEIVNCDSVAMYREFEIGTAKPNRDERACVPHHLFDVIEPTAYITAGEYARQARQVMDEIKTRGRLPIVVGGTGLYLRALLEGLFPGPQRSDELRERLRERADKKGSAYLHRILCRLDPEAAGKIHANDKPKLIRALEICLASREQMTEMWKQGRDALQGFRILRLGLNPDRDALYERINERARCMFEDGLVEETKHLMQTYGDSARPLGSLGYKQAVQLLHGEVTRESAIAAAQQAHRNYAKRQMTWFRREPDVVWIVGFGADAQVQHAAIESVAMAQGAGLTVLGLGS
jgi:tRNA dimethylallyltransferase